MRERQNINKKEDFYGNDSAHKWWFSFLYFHVFLILSYHENKKKNTFFLFYLFLDRSFIKKWTIIGVVNDRLGDTIKLLFSLVCVTIFQEMSYAWCAKYHVGKHFRLIFGISIFFSQLFSWSHIYYFNISSKIIKWFFFFNLLMGNSMAPCFFFNPVLFIIMKEEEPYW